MKKFPLLVLATLSIFVTGPTMSDASSIKDEAIQQEIDRLDRLVAAAQAVDVPNFAQVGGNYLRFTGREDAYSKGYVCYGYDCSVDLKENFAEQFMNYLVQNCHFQFAGHDFKDYIRTSAETFEYWQFNYVGSRYVAPFQKRKKTIPCHLEVGRHKNFQTGITHFSIRIASGLTYGG